MNRLACLVVTVSALMLLLTACGDDSGQGRPVVDTVPPNPPVGVQIETEEAGVLVAWEENPEPDLEGYRIYKSSFEYGPFESVNSRLLMCPWYHDEVLPRAMTYYKVTAVDESGNESAFSQIAGIYDNAGGRRDPDKPVAE